MDTLFAYINPFTGSLILQFLVLALLTGGVFFYNIKVFVLGLFGHKTGAKAEMESSEDLSVKLEEPNKETQKAA